MDAPFDQLANPDAFEQLCFDILEAEGFRSTTWRGPGPDGGRDIEASWFATDPTGAVFETRWYVECKWYSDSVPFSDIEPKLLAASCARADFLLIATSSRVRNTAMDSISEWLQLRANPFRVRYLTGRDVFRLALKHDSVLRRHFPAIKLPAWGEGLALRKALERALSRSSERLTWRVLPAVQLLAGLAPGLADGPTAERFESELDFVASMMRISDTTSMDLTSTRRAVDIAGCIEAALVWIGRRGQPPKWSKSNSCDAEVSAPLFKSVLFEVLHNASAYNEAGDATVTLSVEAHHWVIEVVNRSAEVLLDPWPLVGYRGPLAKARNTVGQGMGCWLAAEGCKQLRLDARWEATAGNWIVRLKGARA